MSGLAHCPANSPGFSWRPSPSQEESDDTGLIVGLVLMCLFLVFACVAIAYFVKKDGLPAWLTSKPGLAQADGNAVAEPARDDHELGVTASAYPTPASNPYGAKHSSSVKSLASRWATSEE